MSDPSADRLPLPLFPLQALLFPGGLLALQIFEVRYLDLIARCHASGAPFGVVALTAGSEVRKPAGLGREAGAADTGGAGGRGDFAVESFLPVGTLAQIVSIERPRPGFMRIRCVGTQRFRVRRSAQQRYGLWVADVDPIAPDRAVAVPDDLAFARTALQDLVRNLEHSIATSGEAGLEVPLAEPREWDDCGWLANRWCEMLPLELAHKHRLLALESPLLRLELVADALGQLGLAAGG